MKGANSPWSCGDVVKRVDLRRGFCFVVVARLRKDRHGQYNCDLNWIGKNAAEGKKGLRPTDCYDDLLNAQKRRKRIGERARGGSGAAAEVSFSESLAWITEIDLAQKKGNLSLAVLQCFVGSLSGRGETRGVLRLRIAYELMMDTEGLEKPSVRCPKKTVM